MTMLPEPALLFMGSRTQARVSRSDESSSPYAWIEALLARYPDISAAELDELVAWFEREASAHDVAMISSDRRIHPGYRRFRDEHIDPLTLRDLHKALVFLSVVAAAVLGVIWMAP